MKMMMMLFITRSPHDKSFHFWRENYLGYCRGIRSEYSSIHPSNYMLHFNARPHICRACYMQFPVHLSVCLSVTGGSAKNGRS